MSLSLDLDGKARLLVILPEVWVGNLDLARKVFRLACQEKADVVYVVPLSSTTSTLPVTRRMVTMTALTSGRQIVASYELVFKANWVGTIKKLCRPQDTVVAPEGVNTLPGSSDLSTLRNVHRLFVRTLTLSSLQPFRKASKRHIF